MSPWAQHIAHSRAVEVKTTGVHSGLPLLLKKGVKFGYRQVDQNRLKARRIDHLWLTMVEPEEVEMLVSPPSLALGNKMQGSASFRVLEKTQLCEKALFQHLVTAGNFYQIRPDDDDGWGNFTPLCQEYSNSRSYPKTRALAAIPAGTIIGPVLDTHIVKIHDRYAFEVAIPSICRPEDTTYVVISRETERFANETHDHKAEARSSDELLENLQESETHEPYEERKVTTRSKETWAAPSMKETRAGLPSLVPNKASFYTRRTIPTSERIWKTIHANASQGRHLAVSISKAVTTMLRHFDAEILKSVLVEKVCT